MTPFLLGPSFVARATPLLGALAFSFLLVDCVDTRSTEKAPEPPPPDPCEGVVAPSPIGVAVTIDLGAELATVPPDAYGMHASVYDNALHHPDLPELLHESGVELLRYPGGGYAEMYHFSNHTMSETPDDDDPDTEPERGYLADRSDFGNFVGIVESFGGRMMITVNYGSNLQGTGPGEPKEAAAWVAYANGDPDDERVIGVDGADNDWQTVGFWASLRASEPLLEAEDDGFNHLRIAHPEPLGIEYWEIGNEVFGNGYNDANSEGFAYDLHVPYDGTPRYQNPLLSGTTYGQGVVAYLEEMKAVDPSIKIGAVLGTPPADNSWGRPWNNATLAECADVIDFGIVHWYPDTMGVRGGSPLPALLAAPKGTIPHMVSQLHDTLVTHAGDRANDIELVMTEVGPGNTPRIAAQAQGVADRSQAVGLFALDTYLTLIEHGFTNVDWLELHNGSFLSERRDTKGPAFNGIRMAHLLAGPGDRLVSVTTDPVLFLAHASVREDGRVGVLLSNTQAPEQSPATFTLDFLGGSVGSVGERYDYFASPSVAPENPDARTAPAACVVLSGANGSVVGPTPFSNPPGPVTVEVPPYGVTLLLFEPG